MAKRLPRPEVGQRFGRLKVFIPVGWKKGYPAVLCVCDCGTLCAPLKSNLYKGVTKSCGCLNKELASARQKTHGMSRTPIYGLWKGIRERCNDPDSKEFHRYGGRGIRVCSRWDSFQNFFDDMGYKPEGMSLERKDNNGNYSPENCVWATSKEQARNKRSNRMVTYKGETKCATDWALDVGLKPAIVIGRLHLGWSVERALTTPVRKRRNADNR